MTGETGADARTTSERARREAEIYDSHALRRKTYDSILEYADRGPARQRRDAFVRRVMKAQAGRRVLEIGSSAWEGLLHHWRIQPASLTCINISEAELGYGRKRAESCGVPVDFRLMDANSLKFPDGSFDFIFGIAILHHLDFARAVGEIHRVCARRASILFIEPLALNPVARVVRRLTPHARTPDERPLGRQELATVERLFETDHLYTDLLHLPAAVASRLVFKDPVNALTNAFDTLDRGLLRIAPALGPYFRTITIHGRKRESGIG